MAQCREKARQSYSDEELRKIHRRNKERCKRFIACSVTIGKKSADNVGDKSAFHNAIQKLPRRVHKEGNSNANHNLVTLPGVKLCEPCEPFKYN